MHPIKIVVTEPEVGGHHSIMKRTTLPLSILCLSLAACDLGKPGDLGDLTDSTTDAETGDSASSASSSDTEEPTTGPGSATEGDDTTGGLAPATAIDVLFVIDNSGSMAASQQRIADAIGAFVDPITGAGLDLRIAVTTTDAGNPRCPSSTPENGAFVASSCRARVPDGEFASNDVDYSAACLDSCQHDTIDILPTTTASDPVASPRPWVEWSPGATNLAVPLAEALACMVPQGVAGCGFESQLNSLYQAVVRMQSPDDPAAGFLRTDAHFVAIIVTDETDCSHNPDFDDIFTTNKTFWFNQEEDVAPTSSMCWSAGVQCSGGPGVYDDCVAVDHDSVGNVTINPDEAVLHPVSRYNDLLADVQADKLAAGSAAKVQVVVIGGVPAGYPQNPIVYADGDPDQQVNFGIAPGCDHMGITAVPPARMLAVAEANDPLVQSMYSICQTNLAGPLSAIASGIVNN